MTATAVLLNPADLALNALPLPLQAEIRPLGRNDIPAMLALQQSDGDGQIIMRNAEKLESHFNAGHGGFGAFIGNRLVGQALVTVTRDVPAESLSATFSRIAAGRRFDRSTLTSVVVAADARGQDLMGRLIKAWEKDALERQCTILHANVGVENVSSWKNFLKPGRLCITDTGISPDTGREIYSMFRPLNAAFRLSAINDRVASQATESIVGNLKKGYIGKDWDQAGKTLVMARCLGLTMR